MSTKALFYLNTTQASAILIFRITGLDLGWPARQSPLETELVSIYSRQKDLADEFFRNPPAPAGYRHHLLATARHAPSFARCGTATGCTTCPTRISGTATQFRYPSV